jgi:hypothetical protein
VLKYRGKIAIGLPKDIKVLTGFISYCVVNEQSAGIPITESHF